MSITSLSSSPSSLNMIMETAKGQKWCCSMCQKLLSIQEIKCIEPVWNSALDAGILLDKDNLILFGIEVYCETCRYQTKCNGCRSLLSNGMYWRYMLSLGITPRGCDVCGRGYCALCEFKDSDARMGFAYQVGKSRFQTCPIVTCGCRTCSQPSCQYAHQLGCKDRDKRANWKHFQLPTLFRASPDLFDFFMRRVQS